MKTLFESANVYLKQADWKDLALVKFCLFSMGLLCGCFVPKKIDGLFTAGRCISGTHRAHASYRVMSICMAMGQAVGVAAAMCAQRGCTPRQLDVKDLQKELTALGIELFDE